MTDKTKYKNVSLKKETYDKLEDLSAMNKMPVSKSGLVSYLVDKEWRYSIKYYQIENYPELSGGNFLTNTWDDIVSFFSRSSSEGKSNDNW